MNAASAAPWYRRPWQRLNRSVKLRLVLVFLLLATAMTLTFLYGAQRAFSVGWSDAARPLLADYVDQLARDVTQGGPTPHVDRAQAIAERLPVTIRIQGPRITWESHPQRAREWQRQWQGERWRHHDEHDHHDGPRLLQRATADGHVIDFGINPATFERRPQLLGYVLATVLLLTLLAWLYVRRLLKPLDDIGAGARRFGAGEFTQPIPLRHPARPDELGQLAATINTMGHDIHQMLEAKRALLLAISHELRSPLTRARLHTELLPETADVTPQRQALLRDLQEMAGLINDLLESERLSTRHAALQREPLDLDALAREVAAELQARHPQAHTIRIDAEPDLPRLALDPSRLRVLLRNLLDNALRHGAVSPPPELRLHRAGTGIRIEVRDHGPGVPEHQLPHLAEAFYRPDSARTRQAGGVGLGLYLCRLVAQAHGGRFAVHNAQPGLRVTVDLPG